MKFLKEMNFSKEIKFPQVANESGFRLTEFRNGEINWRLIGDIEVDKLLRQQNLEQLDSVLMHLAEAPLAAMLDTNILDSGIVKYFILSQYAIQYLLFCRNFLDETVSNLHSVYSQSQHDVALLRKSLNEANAEILQLHKKITHIEAIREVIYPCHLCNKCFINNDSLNIHLNRKHGSHTKQPNVESTHKVGNISPERMLNGQRTRENDLSLITCIKLELEMKQLKERLNHAEKQLQHHPSVEKSHLQLESVTTQCNLLERKEQLEKDESELESESTANKNIEIEKSQNCQHEEVNRQTLKEIYDRLQSITAVVNDVKELKEKSYRPEKDIDTNSLMSEHLVRQITQKVDELSEINSAKFDKAMSNIEQNCNQKLASIEQEIQHKIQVVNKTSTSNQMAHINSHTRIPVATKFAVKLNPKREYKDTEIQTETVEETPKQIFEAESQLSVGSNSTFIRSNSPTIKELPKIDLSGSESESESTSVSESLDSISETSSDLVLRKKTKNKKLSKPTKPKKVLEAPKPFTRNKAKLIYNRRLEEINCHYKQEILSSKSMQKITQQLNDKRIQNKKKYPQFYATRNRIKTYVEKLCSTQSNKSKKETKTISAEVSDDKLDNSPQAIKLPEPEMKIIDTTNVVENKNFRERLERILASPIQRPTESFKPVPVPRKRVVFNT